MPCKPRVPLKVRSIFLVPFESDYNARQSYYETEQELEDLDMDEVSQEIKDTFVKHEGPAVLSCGDDRGPTAESLKAMAEQGLPIEGPYLRIFGGIYGATRALLVAAVAQHGEEALQTLGTDFHELSHEVARRAADRDVIMMTHSAEGAEGNPTHIDQTAGDKLGCAYGDSIGVVANLSAHDQLVIRSAEYEATSLFGSPQDGNVQKVVQANRVLVDEIFGRQEPMSISKGDVIETKVPGMVLKGAHAKTEDVKHVYSFSDEELSDPVKAVEQGTPFYDTDLTQVAELLIKSFPELNLDSDLVANAIILDVNATKAALAASDGGARDPQRIVSLRYGDPHKALAHLSAL